MGQPAIVVENLGKKYKIGLREKLRHRRFGDALVDAVKAPFRRLRQLGEQSNGEDIFWALKDVSFEVQPGEVVGIIGRNGAGKSTLLKILSRITDPTTGRAVIHGRVGSLLEVGTGFHPELTGRENIYLNGAILGMKKAEITRKFDEIVAFAEVEKFLDTPVKRYSSGMYVRLAFAVAAHLDPEILIVDEVLAVGDALFQKKCLGKMQGVASTGRTVLFVSHNMTAVTQFCRSATWLDQGRIRQSGLSSEVVNVYISEGSTQIAQRRWSYPGDAPGDDRVRLLEARLVQDETCTSIVDINRALRLEMVFLAIKPLSNLVAAANVSNDAGLCLFCTPDWRPNALPPGRYRKCLSIPARLLAEGNHAIRLELVFYAPHIRSIVFPDALSFTAVDSDDPTSVRGPYKGSWPGLVRPGLIWDDAVRLDSKGES